MKLETRTHDDALPGRMIPVTEWHNYHPWPTEAGLRHLIFNAEKNGFDKVVKRVGRRCLIDEQAFLRFVDSKGTRHE